MRARPILVIVVVAACTAMPPPTASPARHAVPHADVPTYRGDPARTGAMPGPGPAAEPTVAWRYAASGPIRSSPAVVDGVVFVVTGDGSAHALDLASGTERWRSTLDGRADASPLVEGGSVIVGDAAASLHALDARDGGNRWTSTFDGPITGAAASDGHVVIAASALGTVYAIDPRTGDVAWQVAVGGGVSRSIAIAAGSAYLGTDTGALVALSLAGDVLWDVDLVPKGEIGTPTVAGGLVYAATGLDGGDASDRGVTAVDAETGSFAWRYESPTARQLYTPAVVDGRAHIVGEDSAIVTLGATDGSPIWSAVTEGAVEALPAVADGVVYVASNGGAVTALAAATGTIEWTVPIEGIPFAPVVVDGYILVGTSLGLLYAIGGPERQD